MHGPTITGAPPSLLLPLELSSAHSNTASFPLLDPSILASARETKASKEGSPTAPTHPPALWRVPFEQQKQQGQLELPVGLETKKEVPGTAPGFFRVPAPPDYSPVSESTHM